MTAPLTYDPSAAVSLLDSGAIDALKSGIEAAREAVRDEVTLFNSGGNVPEKMQPLDSGFIEYPAKLLAEGGGGMIEQIEDAANSWIGELHRVVLLGIGGSYMGAKALFDALLSPYHNECAYEARGGIPKISFGGNNLDDRDTSDLLSLISEERHRLSEDDFRGKWGIVVISKSGGTLETAAAFRIFRELLEEHYGADSDEARRFVIPVTGEVGKLRDLSNERGYPATFPVPDGIGGRFSILTPVGLLPAALMGLDIRELLEGAQAMTDRFFNEEYETNPVLQYVAVCHAWEQQGADIRVLSTWGSRLEAAGFWYDQLLSESLGKHEKGATPITVVNTRDLHSRGQQHQEGKRDKLITNMWPASESELDPVALPTTESDHDQLNKYAGKTIPQLLDAAIEGTNQAYADDNRPTADLILPTLNEHALGQYFQMMMLATVLEGRLLDINPYGQPGVEGYKQNMTKILSGS